jgi:hypothetical protein
VQGRAISLRDRDVLHSNAAAQALAWNSGARPLPQGDKGISTRIEHAQHSRDGAGCGAAGIPVVVVQGSSAQHSSPLLCVATSVCAVMYCQTLNYNTWSFCAAFMCKGTTMHTQFMVHMHMLLPSK